MYQPRADIHVQRDAYEQRDYDVKCIFDEVSEKRLVVSKPLPNVCYVLYECKLHNNPQEWKLQDRDMTFNLVGWQDGNNTSAFHPYDGTWMCDRISLYRTNPY